VHLDQRVGVADALAQLQVLDCRAVAAVAELERDDKTAGALGATGITREAAAFGAGVFAGIVATALVLTIANRLANGHRQ
jgi:hypothetical protein